VSEAIWRWWDEALARELQDALLLLHDDGLDPDLALELWRSTESFRVIVGIPNEAMDGGYDWRLSPEVAEFVAERGHEMRHPEDFR
jgi:hypothetical protein